MNIQEYISSGIIESYVLGQLSGKERAELEAMARKHPEIMAEVEAVENSILEFTSKVPPAELKDKIRKQLNIRPETKVVPFSEGNSTVMTWIAAASVILLVGSAIYNFVLIKEIRNVESQVARLNAEKEKYARDFAEQTASYQQMAAEMSIMMKPENMKVMLRGMDAAPGAVAAVYWNQDTKDVFLNVASLPMPAPGKQYQLWAIVDGKPVDAGVFDMDSSMLHKMKSIDGAQAFAVTLENRGGSPAPTMNAMYLMGNI